MNIFLDANILVSVLNKEYPAYSYTSRILSLADSTRFTVYTSPICLAIAFYFSEKKSGAKLALKKLNLLASKIKVAANTSAGVMLTTQNVKVHDFEDGLEYYTAIEFNCECIIKEDVGDFYFSEIEVLTSQDFFAKYLC